MYLVTGGAGFIGSHTVAALEAEGQAVRVLDDLSTGHSDNLAGLEVELVVGSITDADLVAEVLDGVSHVIHLAARPGVPDSVDDPVDFDRVNVHGTLVVFEAARQAGVERVAYASSAAVYGSVHTPPLTEGLAAAPESPYGLNKSINEQYGALYQQLYGFETVGLRYFNVFGPRQDPNGPYAAVIPTFLKRALAGQPLVIFGDGEQTRDFVSVQDVAAANLAAVRSSRGAGRAFNIGGGGSGLSINRLAAYVAEAVGGSVAIEHAAERAGDIKHSTARIEAAAEALDWRPEADFDAAMAETLGWYRELFTGS